jgi:hypothetical protein
VRPDSASGRLRPLVTGPRPGPRGALGRGVQHQAWPGRGLETAASPRGRSVRWWGFCGRLRPGAMREARSAGSASGRSARGAHNAMQRRCAEPGRRPALRRRWAPGAARRHRGSAAAGRSNRENGGAATRCNDVALTGRFRPLTALDNFEARPPGGAYGQADRGSSSRRTGGISPSNSSAMVNLLPNQRDGM